MLVRRAVAAPLLVAVLGILAAAACQGEGEEETPSPTPTIGTEVQQGLEQFSPSDLLHLAFPDVAFRELPTVGGVTVYLLEEEPVWRVETLGQLVGCFTRIDQPQSATFVYLRGSEEGDEARSRLLDLPEGVFIALVELDGRGQPVVMGWSFLEASGDRLLDVSTALNGANRPYRQGDSASPTSIRPALTVDADNDGLKEMVLLEVSIEDGIQSTRYLAFRWTGPGFSWKRLDSEEDGGSADLPAVTVLNYLATVDSATGTVARWEDLDRLLVLNWLSGDDETVPDELLTDLAAGAPEAEVLSIRRQLEATRTLLRRAFDLWSAEMQERQPWPDFINGFRTTTGVAVEEMLAPRQIEGKTVVEVVLIARSREGPDLVQRRFRVIYELVEEDGDWWLDSVDAKEERGPE